MRDSTTSCPTTKEPQNIWRNSGLERGCVFPRSHSHWQDSAVEKLCRPSLLASEASGSFGRRTGSQRRARVPPIQKGSLCTMFLRHRECSREPTSRPLNTGSTEFTGWPLAPGCASWPSPHSLLTPGDQLLGFPIWLPLSSALCHAGPLGPAWDPRHRPSFRHLFLSRKRHPIAI